MDDIDKTIEEFEKGSKSTWNGKPTINAKKCQQMVEWLKNYKRLREKNEEEFIRNKLDMIHRNSIYGLYAANSSEIARIIHSYIGRDIGFDHDRMNCPKPPIYIGPVKVKTLKERLEETKMKTTIKQTIKNVNDISFSIENDPVEMDSKLIIVASTDNDIFEFKFEAQDPLNICKIAKLFAGWEQDQKIRELEEENKQLKEELDLWKKEAAECLILRDRAQEELAMEKAANEAQHKFIKKYAGKGTEIDFNYAIDDVKEVSYVIVDKKKYESLKDTGNRCTMINGKSYTYNQMVSRIMELEEKEKKMTALNDDLEQERETILEENDNLRYAFDDEVEENKKLRERIKNLKDRDCSIMIHGKIYNSVQIVDRILDLEYKVKEYKIKELKELKTPTIENFADKEPCSRRDILHAAEKCVCGQREQDYGTPESNFQLIADLWNGYLGKERLGRSKAVVDEVDVAMMMSLMKIARIKNGGGSGDSFVDLAGYAACGGEIWYGRKAQVPEGE